MKRLLILTVTVFLTFSISCKKDKVDVKDTPNPKDEVNGILTDISGNKYKTVKIGKQWWMAENLKTNRLNNGTPISRIETSVDWKAATEPAYCWYKFDSVSYSSIYGAMYNWFTVRTGLLCPAGWRVPTDEDWMILEQYIGVQEYELDLMGWRGCESGGKLKGTGTTYWKSPNYGATNKTGFSALPGGHTDKSGFHGDLTQYTYFWTSSLHNPYSHLYVLSRGLNCWDGCIARVYYRREEGCYVRCIKE